jgi:uncharacterized membrane protein
VHNESFAGLRRGKVAGREAGGVRLRCGEATMSYWADIGWTLAWCAVLALLIALAVYLVGRFRGHADDDQPHASDMLPNFRELHSRGELSDGEFRTIKTLLKRQLEDELKDTSDTG